MKKIKAKSTALFPVGFVVVAALAVMLFSNVPGLSFVNVAHGITTPGTFSNRPLSVPTAGVGNSTDAISLTEVQSLIETIARWIIVVAVVIAVIAIIYGGVMWITAGNSEDRQKNAKKILSQGIVGALIVLAIGVIMQTLAGVVARTFFS